MTAVNIGKTHPEAYQQMLALNETAEKALAASGLDTLVGHLVKLRASQLNGCAFCLKMHTEEALKDGESIDRITTVAAWWETQYFTPVEQAALALTEELTQMPVRGERTFDTSVLTDEQISAITWVIVVINAWNRIAVSSHYPVGK